ncbi:MAG TPA: prolyl oligopeptidase family serine peptidase [Cellvibrionaceae bacterium]|nr:prolyl oligopeptidase family serine peptidase [Cellvibrionaceae bacterium]HMY39429.1 prolyl oligopeptidase family serine peptidase [Marinagarivorans sp.]
MPNHQSPPKQAPYGFWESPISVDAVLANAIQPMYPQGASGWLFWLEARPAQKGRQVIVAQLPDGTKRELLPEEHSARSQFLEYGGCPFWLAGKELIWVNAQDQNLYAMDFARPAAPRKLTQSGGRYADIQWDTRRNRILAVMETPSDGLSSLSIASIDLSLEEQTPRVLQQGADFYAYLSLAPNGQQLAFIQWHQGHMPWDATALMLAEVNPDGSLAEPATWVAEEAQQAIAQPQFGPDGCLYWVSDATNWWNLYRRQGEKVEALAPMEAECTTPRWVSGMSSYCCVDADEILFCYTQGGLWNLARLNTQNGQWQPLLTDYPHISQLSSADGGALFLAAEPQGPIQIYHYSDGQVQPLAAPAPDELQAYYSQPKSIYVPSDGYNLHAFYYPPHNPDYSEPEGLPPVIVLCHGGPTGQTSALLNLKNQYWTSRGFAVLDVNYRGSTGFGRAFRHSLHGAWGQADVADLCNAAQWVSAQGLAGLRFIKGSSAGGFSVLAALAFHHSFDGGVSLYGIGDLALLAQDTHTFEARYLDSLVGPYPEQAQVYAERSPLFAADQIRCPVLIFQGLLDKVVPPNQAQDLVATLKHQGTAVTYVEFAEEGHGFRQAQSIREQLAAEQVFYQQVISQ